jgi:hypothetical protein
MSKATDQMLREIKRDWRKPTHEVKVLEWIERPEWGVTICVFNVHYIGTAYTATRMKMCSKEGGGYETQIASEGDIMETVPGSHR